MRAAADRLAAGMGLTLPQADTSEELQTMDPQFDGVIFKTHARELRRRMNHPHPPYVVLDVRDAPERQSGSIAGSVAATAASLEQGLPEGTTRSTEFFVVGTDRYDPRIRDASRRLLDSGAVRVVELAGGMAEWTHEGLPVATPSKAA